MAFRSHYWACSKFANWLRGASKPIAATAEGWDEWHDESKKSRPIRYWLAEEGLDMVQNFVNWPFDKLHNVRCYINNRWVLRSHSLTAHRQDIKPGDWCDVGNRFLPCLFNELVDFVEVESAWHHCMWSDSESKKYNVPWWRKSWLKLRAWRCPEAGIDSLKWQSELKFDEDWIDKDDERYGQPTPQAVNAKEILELYTWWTEVYRKRQDPYDESGLTALYEADTLIHGSRGFLSRSKDESFWKRREVAHEKLKEIEAQRESEDTEMMIRLIKVRGSLWT